MPTAEITETVGCAKKLRVTVERERLDSERVNAVRTVKRGVDVPGFRKGKAPDAIILQRYGATVTQEALKDLIPRVIGEVLDEKHIHPVSDPDVSDLDLPEEGPITFMIHVEESPAIDVDQFAGLPVTKEIRTLTNDMVEHEVERIRRMKAEQNEVDRPVAVGDIIVADLQKLDVTGVPIVGERMENQVIALDGRSTPSPDFDGQVVGMSRDESRRVTITYDDSIDNPDLVGKTESYEITVKKVYDYKVPELTDEFAASLGKFATADDFRKAVRERLEAQFEVEAERRLHDALIEEFVKLQPFEVPPSMVTRVINSEIERYKRSGGGDFDENALRQRMRPDAVRAVQTYLIVETVIDKLNIEIAKEEVDARIERLAEVSGATPRELKRRLIKEGQLDDLRHDIARRKAYDWITGQANITEETAAEPSEPSRIIHK